MKRKSKVYLGTFVAVLFVALVFFINMSSYQSAVIFDSKTNMVMITFKSSKDEAEFKKLMSKYGIYHQSRGYQMTPGNYNSKIVISVKNHGSKNICNALADFNKAHKSNDYKLPAMCNS